MSLRVPGSAPLRYLAGATARAALRSTHTRDELALRVARNAPSCSLRRPSSSGCSASTASPRQAHPRTPATRTIVLLTSSAVSI
eukprot:5194792-Pleurochrysis_carterae.AAC.2